MSINLLLEQVRTLWREVNDLKWRLGDVERADSAAQTVALRDGINAPTAVTGLGLLYIDESDGHLKLKLDDSTYDLVAADHGALSGLGDDDHSQYLNTARHDTTDRHGSSVVDHGSIGGLSDDDHSQYALLAGRSGGQTVRGGTAAGDDLTLDSTANASKGYVLLQPSGGNVGVGTNNPSAKLHVAGRVIADGVGLLGSKASIASGTPTALCDIVVSPSVIMYSFLIGLTATGSGVASGQLWAVTGGWNAVGVNKLSEGLFGHSNITLTGSMTTDTRTLRLTVTQTTGSGVPCTVNISVLPLIGGADTISSLTML